MIIDDHRDHRSGINVTDDHNRLILKKNIIMGEGCRVCVCVCVPGVSVLIVNERRSEQVCFSLFTRSS